MIKPEQIPYEVTREIWMACSWDNQRQAQEALAQALSLWPGLKLTPFWELRTHKKSVEAVLPLLNSGDQ